MVLTDKQTRKQTDIEASSYTHAHKDTGKQTETHASKQQGKQECDQTNKQMCKLLDMQNAQNIDTNWHKGSQASKDIDRQTRAKVVYGSQEGY